MRSSTPASQASGSNTIQFTGVDERCEDRERLSTALAAPEQRVLSPQGHGFHLTLDDIGFHQSAPVVERVGDGFAQRRFRRHLVA